MILKYGADAMKSDKKGFTLIEIMVAIAIFSIFSVAMMKVYTGSTRSYATQEVAADVQQNLRAAMNIMVQDIRMAGFDPMSSELFGITEATANKFRFTNDLLVEDGAITLFDSSNRISSQFEEITYEWVAADSTLYMILEENIGINLTQPLVNNVTDLSFTYYDAAGSTPPASLDDIRSVDISMTIEEDAGRGGTVSRTLSTAVWCRNLGY